jgi:hypothetical protein
VTLDVVDEGLRRMSWEGTQIGWSAHGEGGKKG